MKLDKSDMLLYAVTDRRWSKNKPLTEQIEDALKGGASCLQLREKNLSFDEFLAEATEVKSLCKKYSVPLIINDNVDVAVKCNADGIHIGQHDMTLSEVRRIVGDDMIIGVSAQTVEQAKAAERDGADYLGVGAVFNTGTKLDATNVTFNTLKSICNAVSIPVVAIGGIGKDNISKLVGSGIDGVALVSAIFSAEDIEAECRSLRCAVERIVKR